MALSEVIALRKLRREVEKGNELKEREVKLLEEIKGVLEETAGLIRPRG